MQTVYVAGGNVGMSQLISGEIQNLAGVAVMSTTSAATEYQIVRPTPCGTASAGAGMMGEVSLGVSGQAGDYLAGLEISNSDTSNAAIFLEDGNEPATTTTLGVPLTGTTGGATVPATAVIALPVASITMTQNQFTGYLLAVSYTPTNGVAIKTIRKIVSHAAHSGLTTATFTVTHAYSVGAAPTFWEVLPLNSSYEVQPFNTPVGRDYLPMGRVSTYGAWRVSVDSAVQVVASGIFSG